MSTTVDSRVVEMRFDNRHFEQNVSTTMSTLEKLKQKLRFDGATKGLEDVNSAVGKVDLSPIGTAAEKVGLRFSAMYTMADQAFRNITNAAMQAGKNIVSSLTIDPVKTGLSEYETKMNAIQVIKANTRGKNTMDDITGALEELNQYADRTIYNFTQMTSNVGKFVAQGLDVHQASKAVQGLANLAGASGASAEDMARATYQMSQALGGTIRKIDWNSLRNANMATVELKNTLMDIARVRGIDIDGMIKDKGNFEETLSKGWLTGELFTEAMNIYSDVYSEAELKAKGFSDAQVKNFKDLAKMAQEATTEVKTFSQLWDVLKETAQSGWTQTWELIFGDFDTAKAMFTDLQNYFSNIINTMSAARNWVVEGVLNFTKPWTAIMEKLDGAGLGGITKMVENVKNAADTLTYFKDVVNRVWRGEFNNKGDNPDRYDLLEKAGYNHKVVQDLVNKGRKSKSGNNLTMDDVIASHKKYGVALEETTKANDKATESVDEMTFALENLSDEELKSAGLTEDEIKLFRDIAEEAKRTGVTFDELVDKMSNVSGRSLLIDSVKNAWSGLLGIAKALKEAFSEIFPMPSIPRIYTMIESLNKFSEGLRLTDKKTGELNETGKKFKRIFKGVFALVDIIATVVGGALRIALGIAGQLLDYFGLTILDVAAAIGDVLVKIHDWFDSLFNIQGLLEVVVPIINKGVEAIKGWFDAFKASDGLKKASKYIKNIGTSIKEWWTSLKDAENLPKTIAEGIVNFFSNIPTIISTTLSHVWKAIKSSFKSSGESPFSGIFSKLTDGLKLAGQTIEELGKILLEKVNGFLTAHGFKEISKDAVAGLVKGLKEGGIKAWNAAVEMVKLLVTKVKEFLGIHSPSVLFAAIGSFIVAGLIIGITSGAGELWTTLRGTIGKVVEFFQGIDYSQLFAAGMALGVLFVANKIADALSVFEDIGGMFENIGDAIKDLGKGLKDVGKSAKLWALSKVIIAFAIAIGVLAASVLVLSLVPQDKMWSAVGAVAVLVAVLGGLVAALLALSSKLNVGTTVEFSKIALVLVGLAGSLLLIAIALRVLSGIDDVGKTLLMMAGILVLISVLMRVVSHTETELANIGGTMLKLAIAIGILVLVAKMITGVAWEDMVKAAVGLVGLGVIVAGLIAATKLAGEHIDQAGSTLIKIAAAFLILTIVAKMIARMEWSEMGKAAVGLLGLTAIVGAFLFIAKLYDPKDLTKVGSTLLAVAGCIAILTIVAKLIARMEWSEMGKAAVGLLGLTAIIVLLIGAINLYKPKDLTKVTSTLLAMSVAIGILGLVVALIGMLSIEHLARGLVAVGILGAVLSLMIWATRGASDCKGNLIAMTVAIGIMAAAAVALSFIDPRKLAPAVVGMSMLMAMFALMISSTKDIQANGMLLGSLITLTVMIGLIGFIIYKLAELDSQSVLGSGAALALAFIGLSIAIGALGDVSKVLKKAKIEWGDLLKSLALLGMTVAAMYAIVGALALMSGMQNALSNAIGLGVVLGVVTITTTALATIAALFKKAKLDWAELLKSFALLGGVIVALYAVVGALALMSGVQNAIPNAIALGILLPILASVVAILAVVAMAIKDTKIKWDDILQSLTLLGGVIVALYAVVGALALMSGVQNAIPNAIALGILMPILASVAGILGVVGMALNEAKIGWGAILQSLALLGGVILAAVGVAYVLKSMQGLQNAESNAIVLCGVLIAFSLIAAVLGGVGAIMGKVGWMALTSLIMLAGVIAAAELAVLVLWHMDACLKNAEKNAKILIDVLLAFSIISLISAGIGAIIAATVWLALTGLISLAGILVAAELVALILWQMDATLKNAEKNARILCEVLLAFSLVALVFSTVGVLALLAAPMIGPLMTLLGLLTGVIIALGLLNTWTDGAVEDFIDNTMPLLVKLADGLGQMVGKFINSFFTTATECLPLIGERLSAFMEKATPFLDGVKKVDESVLKGVGIIAGAILALTAVDLVTGIANFFSGGSSLAQLGAELGLFMHMVKPFLDGMATVDPKVLDGVKAISETILMLTAAELLEGLTGWLTGGSSLSAFSSQLPALGTNINEFAKNVRSFADDNVTKAVSGAANSIKTLAEAAGAMPKENGWLQTILGENGLASFSANLPTLGTNLSSFAGSVDKFKDENVTKAVTGAADSIKALAGAANELPKEKGWLQTILGENGLATFSANLPTLGENLKGFSEKVSEFTPQTVETIKYAAESIKAIAGAADALPKENGWLQTILGENSLATFAGNLPTLGTNLAGFAKNVSEFTPDTATSVGCAADAIKEMAEAGSSINGQPDWAKKLFGDNSLATFSGQLATVGENLKAFVEKLGTFTNDQVATVRSAVSAINALSGLAATDLKSAKSNLSGFGDKLPGFAEDIESFCTKMPSTDSMRSAVSNVDKLLGAVKNIAAANSGALATFAENLMKVGEDAVSKFIGAFTSEAAKTDLNGAAETLAGEAVSGAGSQSEDMKSAGHDLGDGLAAGIREKKDDAWQAGYELGQSAVAGEKAGQQSNSPSKLTIQAGKWIGEGLVIGMGKMGGKVYSAGHDLGDTATKTISSSIARISDMVSSDIDTQPTIRPVLDLSDVRSGAAALGNMLNMDSSVGVHANLGAISSMMSARGQNGANADVVSELAKLRKDIGNMNNTTNVINGITYDDGSNITDAVATLVRAAKIERRM